MSVNRPQIHGRSIVLGSEKLHVRGATYGTFRPTDGWLLPPPDQVNADFEAMAAVGINSLRTYESPPSWLLDTAQAHGLKVMVGLAWEQHIAFLDEPGRAKAITAKVVEQVRSCAAHPAILAYALGNEIPAPIVRWHGKRPVEDFLERLYWEAKAADPEGLFAYINYPSTEYLELPFLDLAAFNVFLEDERTFESYLARLQNLAGDRPLLIAEVGIDSRRNGEEVQARTLEWQVRHAFGTGAAGVFVFSWTDEWHRGGHEVTDWDFGLVDRERQPKQALAAARGAFGAIPFSPADCWPRVSVVVCTHNGERTLGQCLERANELAYPDFELIVVDDGSTDGSADIALARGATLVQTEHRGLSFARNAGVAKATGEIVAFLDDDAYPDSDWLRYVAASLGPNAHAGTGGPNIPPDDDGWIAECVAAAPGGPIHVLISDREAEHVPGCNMAFRNRRWRRSVASTSASASPATTSTSAGACRNRGARSASAPAPWSCTAVATRSGATSSSSTATARPRRCWSASGQAATTAPAPRIGRARSTTLCPRSPGGTEWSATGPGAAASSSRSTSRRRAPSPASWPRRSFSS